MAKMAWEHAKLMMNNELMNMDIKELDLVSKEKYEGDILSGTAKILKTQPEYTIKTVERFVKDLQKYKTFIRRI